MAEDAGDDHVIDQLQKSDLRAGVYEGGFKTWESSIDLASLLLDRGPRKDIDELIRCDNVVEVNDGLDHGDNADDALTENNPS
jgi:protein-histidine N-methyltransferase